MNRENEQEKQKQIMRLKQIGRKKYLEEAEKLNIKSNTSFGKLILADEKTAPGFSFGSEKKFHTSGTIQYKKTPGPIYKVTDKFKFNEKPSWTTGKAKRPPIYTSEKYEYYNHPYDDKFDFGKINHKWKKSLGGAIGLDPRIKYDLRENAPGPGRYEPEVKFVKPKTPFYYFGEKTELNSLKLLVGTNDTVGPGSYKVEKASKTSIHQNPPSYTLQKAERRGLNNKVWTKTETYYMYSSCYNQVDSNKLTMPKINFGKSDRAKSAKCGIFRSHMSKQPTRVRIDHPKI